MVSELSVFFPAYNEESNLSTTVEKALKVLEKLNLKRYEVIIVNDGSKDKTGEVADQLAKTYKEVQVIHHPQNKGYGEALKSGFYSSKYDWIAFNDSDGQFDFSEITKLIEKTDEADFIAGYRINRQDNFIRKLNGWGWTFISNLFLGIGVRDVDCAFKLLKKEVIEKIPKLKSSRGGMISPELVALTRRKGFKIVEVGVHHYPRKVGEQTGANLKVIITSFVELFKLWWKLLEKKELILILILLAIAAFLRFYKLGSYMTFLGDEGRDALIIKDLLENRNIPFIGPPTSVGTIYLGPFYYYMMAFPMAIFWLNPVAAASQVALIGVLTVWLVFYLTKLWFGKEAGFVAGFLYAISPVTVMYSRSSWNPNPLPFFTLLGVLSLYKLRKTSNGWWLILTGFSLAAAIQMHYLALILVPIFGFMYLYQLSLHFRNKIKVNNLLMGTVFGFVTFWAMMLPLILFDLKHEYLNFRGIVEMFSSSSSVSITDTNPLIRIGQIYSNTLIGDHIAGKHPTLSLLVSVLILIPFLVSIYKKVTRQEFRWVYLMLGIWLIGGVIGLSFYKQEIYDHYVGFLNPVPFILLGALFSLEPISRLKNSYYLNYLTAAIFIILILMVNINRYPFANPPGNQLQRTQEIARFVINDSGEEPFNFALLSERNYDAAYRFYLDLYGKSSKQVPFDNTNQLYVVCEDKECKPVGHHKYEIAAYGYAKIEKVEEVSGLKVYKLVPNPGGKPQ